MLYLSSLRVHRLEALPSFSVTGVAMPEPHLHVGPVLHETTTVRTVHPSPSSISGCDPSRPRDGPASRVPPPPWRIGSSEATRPRRESKPFLPWNPLPGRRASTTPVEIAVEDSTEHQVVHEVPAACTERRFSGVSWGVYRETGLIPRISRSTAWFSAYAGPSAVRTAEGFNLRGHGPPVSLERTPWHLQGQWDVSASR